MPISKVIAAISVNFVVPFFGFIAFVLLCRRMRRTDIPSPPVLHYFILFATYGGWLVVLLTGLFWEWSGMASLGVVYLVLVAPFVTGALAFSLRGRCTLSSFHRAAYTASLVYSGLMLVTIGGWLGIRFLAR